ncbi:MAG: hypothetical protein U0903_13685 [Planctomycetales bacterium]
MQSDAHASAHTSEITSRGREPERGREPGPEQRREPEQQRERRPEHSS